MSEKELVKLVSSLELDQNEKDVLNSKFNTLNNLMQNNLSNRVSIAEFRLGGSYKKGTILPGRKELDIVVVLSPKNKQLFYTLLARINMNEIENCIVYNLKDKLYLSTKENGENFKRNYTRNTMKFTFEDGVSVDFLIRFKKENLYAIERDHNVENFYLERDDQQIKFINKANMEFTKFKNTVKLIKYFRNELNIKTIKSYLIEILLYFSVINYKKGDNYTDYLDSFCKGITTFTNGKIIEVTEQMYRYLGTTGQVNSNDQYKVIDVANKSNNVANYVNDEIIKDFHSLKNHISSIIKDETSNKPIVATVGLYWKDEKNKIYQWGFEVNGVSRRGGDIKVDKNETFNDQKMIILATNRLLQYVLEQKIGNNLIIKTKSYLYDILNGKSNNLFKENEDRLRSLNNYITNSNLNVDYQKVE